MPVNKKHDVTLIARVKIKINAPGLCAQTSHGRKISPGFPRPYETGMIGQ